jgi:hypothetical protein
MSVYKSIRDGSCSTYGDGKCIRCRKRLKELFLLKEHKISARGNEDDYNECFCRDCSKGDKTWEQYEKEQKILKEKEVKELQKDKEKAIEIINKATFIGISEDEDAIYYK